MKTHIVMIPSSLFPAIFENESEMQIKMKKSEDYDESEMENETKCMFSYPTSMRNFEAVYRNISSSIILFFLKSVMVLALNQILT